MREYFSKKIIVTAKKHAMECFPEESCGLIIKDKYIPCENIAANPLNDFKIKTAFYVNNSDDIRCIIHSHNDYPHVSKKDMEQQIVTDVPWGMINVFKGNVTGIYFWGDSLPIKNLTGRPFVHGIYDCYALVRDYYRKEKKITLPIYPRENFWWLKDEHMLMDNFKKEGFIEINKEDLQVGDAILGSVLAKSVNHSGIYLGNGLLLHHLYNRLSRTEPLVRWNKYIIHYLRYEGEK